MVWIRGLGTATFLLLGVLSGCGQAPDRPLEGEWQEQISADGSKRFQWIVPVAPPRTVRREGGEVTPRPANWSAQQERAEEALQVQLKENGFCQSGYLLFENRATQSGWLLRGECREGI